jgi:ribonuclease G
MSKELVVSSNRHETKLAVLEDGQLVEVFFQRANEYSLVGSIHKGRVTRVLPGMQSAFVNIGLERDAFLYVSDFFEEGGEDYERLGTSPAAKTSGDDRRSGRGGRGGGDRGADRGERHDRVEKSGEPRERVEKSPAERQERPASGVLATGERTEVRSGRGERNGEQRERGGGSGEQRERGGGSGEQRERGGGSGEQRERGGGSGEQRERGNVARPVVDGEAVVSADAGAPGAEGEAAQAAGNNNDRRGGRRGRRRRGGSGGGRAGFPDNKFAPAGSVTEEEEPALGTADAGDNGDAEPQTMDLAAVVEAEDDVLILPGESLAKHRRRPQQPTPETQQARQIHHEPKVHAAGVSSSHSTHAAQASRQSIDDVMETAAPGTIVVDHPATPSQAVTEEDITEAIEDAVDARLDELQAAAENAVDEDDDNEPVVRAHTQHSYQSADEAEAAAHLADLAGDTDGNEAGDDELAASGDEDGEADSESDSDADAEPVEAATAEGDSAEVRDQPVARYIQPRPGGRNRRRGGRGRDRDRGDRGPREARDGAAPREEGREGAGAGPAIDTDAAPLESPAGGDIETVARPGRERRPREDKPVPSIADLLKAGQEIIVQIAKEPIAAKGARITSHVAIPGRFVVYMPTLDHHGVSRKVGTDEERARLKRVLQTHSEGMTGGFIVRTAGEGKSEADVAADMSFLYNLWLDIRKKAEKKPAPALLHHDLELVQRILRDQMNDQFKAVWVDTEEMFESIATFLERFQPAMASRLKLYTRPAPIFDAFNITAELEKALRPKVWLKSGGFIVINQTEALVAIDINTGKYVGRTSRLEDTIVKTNVEAVKEVARQIRLRDLGGIIVVDFIDMEERRNRAKVMQALEDAMRTDRAPYKILQFNDFGLVTITRRRVKQSLERALCTPCTTCEGAGYVKSVETVIGEIIVEANKIAKALEGKEVMLRCHPDVAKVLKSNQHHFLEELEEIVGKHVAVTGDPLVHPEKFDMA